MSARRLKLSDTQQHVLQVIMNRGVLDHHDFKAVYSASLKKYGIDDPDQELTQNRVYSQVIREINEAISFYNIEIQKGTCEITGMSFYCFMRQFDTCSIGKLSALYQPQEIKVFQVCLDLIIHSDEGFVSFNEIVDHIRDDYETLSTQAQNESRTITKVPTSREIRNIIDMFISHYWLVELTSNGQRITVHGRALIELYNYFTETFEPEQIKNCFRCKKMCVIGIRCGECATRYHRACAKDIFSGELKACINCKNNFSDNEIAKLKEDIAEARNAYAKKHNRK